MPKNFILANEYILDIIMFSLGFNIILEILMTSYRGIITLSSTPYQTDIYQLTFQEPATPVMKGMVDFHNLLMLFIIFTGIFVFYILCVTIYFFRKGTSSYTAFNFSHNSLLEIIWTLLPAYILLVIAIPSFSLLYSLDEISDPHLTIKVIGHQWYWSYELPKLYSSDASIESTRTTFDVYMVPFTSEGVSEVAITNLTQCESRLLKVTADLALPIYTHIRLLLTSSDVLHSWAVPALGVKVDVCPGRLSQTSVFIDRGLDYLPLNAENLEILHTEPVLFTVYGQCSEICGINHGFMPIGVSAMYYYDFLAHTYPNSAARYFYRDASI
jgi:cytochrome c oxidase subunit 2